MATGNLATRDSTSAAYDGARLNGLGVLSVHMSGAHGLKPADSNGLSDPYCICHVLSESQRTHVVRKSLEPQWGETLEFSGVKLGDVVARGIRLELLDHDVFSRHDPLGELVIDLSQLATVDTWVYSEALPTQGMVEFTVSWIEQDSRLASTGTLTIRLLRATALAAADSNGLSDPYVRLSLGSIKHKSKVVPKSLNPHWDEDFDFKGVLSELTDQFLHVECFDKDTFSRDDPLGSATVPLSALKLLDQKTYSPHLSAPSKNGILHLHASWQGKDVPTSERSSSHDYATCTIVQTGVLRMKVGSLGTWRGRYFELSEAELAYFGSASELKPLGVLPLSCLKKAVASKTDPRRFSLRFAPPRKGEASEPDASPTRTPTRERIQSIELAAADLPTRTQWVRALTFLCGESLVAADSRRGSADAPPSFAHFFGVSLSHTNLVEDGESGLRVPAVLVSLWEEMLRRGDDGLGSEGIFRLSANHEEVSSLKAALDALDPTQLDSKATQTARSSLAAASAQALAALIKLYLRELPDDLWDSLRAQVDALPLADQEWGSGGDGGNGPDELHGLAQGLLYQMSPSAADLVVWVCDVMVAVVAREAVNRMNIGAVSTVFAPGLVHVPAGCDDPAAFMQASERSVQLTTLLLRAHMHSRLRTSAHTEEEEDPHADDIAELSVDISDESERRLLGGASASTTAGLAPARAGPPRPKVRARLSVEDQMAGLDSLLAEMAVHPMPSSLTDLDVQVALDERRSAAAEL